jgi:hypothetical protein
MSECTYCPPTIKQCAHFDGHWVRLVFWNIKYGDDSPYGVFWSWPHPPATDWGFFFPTLIKAEEFFREQDAEMRKFATGEYGDVST